MARPPLGRVTFRGSLLVAPIPGPCRFNDPPLHDPCAVAYVIAPHIFEVRAAGSDGL